MEKLTFLRKELTHQPSQMSCSLPAELATTPNGRIQEMNSLLHWRMVPMETPVATASEVNRLCAEAEG